jgi:hypothetical protein
VAVAEPFRIPRVERDGTSQSGRGQPALDPVYVRVDERSPLDLLRFAKEYAAELRYYDADGEAGDWHGFLDFTPAEMAMLAELVEQPALLTAEASRRFGRPHLSLLLAFLHLLRHPRDLTDTLTRRHLEFYYERVLRMSRKPPVPDRVHVVLRPATGREQVRLPAGTLLRAGKDSLGRERVYRTDRDLVVSRAKVVRLSSVYVERETMGVREARERHPGTRQEAFLRMLEVALGDPGRGHELPKYAGKDVSYALLLDLKKLLGFARQPLFMGLPELHAMMQLTRRRDRADAEWTEINAILERAGRARLHDPTWQLLPTAPSDFTQNLRKAIGAELDFRELPEVENIDDLYHQRNHEAVRTFIHEKLWLSDPDFDRMMDLKIRSDNEWREVNRILERAGRRKRNNPSYKLNPRTPTNFDANLDSAVGPLDFAALGFEVLPAILGLATYYDALQQIEPYFHMNAAQLDYIMTVAERPAGATPAEWARVYAQLAAAHAEKTYAGRRDALRDAREQAATEAAGFHAMMRLALEQQDPERDPLEELRAFVRSDLDYAFLQDAESRLDTGTITTDEWLRIYRVVELAQRTRERLPEPRVERETWLNLHAAADATSVVASSAGGAAAKPQPWKTFGQQPPRKAIDPAESGLIGWAISSPLLLLGQGVREIVLTLGFRSEGFDAAKLTPLLASEQKPLAIQLSTEKGWRTRPASFAVGDYRTLSAASSPPATALAAIQISLSVGADAAAIVTPSPAAAGIAAGWPMLRCMLKPLWSEARQQFVAEYAAFRDLALVAVHLHTKVAELTPAFIQNDEAVLSPKKPFEPFGTSPVVGSRCSIGDPELVVKPLDELTFHLKWAGVPSDLTAHYKNYEEAGKKPVRTFTAQISLVDNHRELPLGKAADLFEADPTKEHAIALSDMPGDLARVDPTFRFDKQVSEWPRHFRWELTPVDFMHQRYPAAATQRALEMAAAIARTPASVVVTDYQVNPPYTPKLTSLRASYEASTELVAQDDSGPDRLFHVHPFGISRIGGAAEHGAIPWLPRHDHEGELYLGLEHVRPPQSLALLFQLVDGSASPELRPVPIEWSYLSGDRWLTLHDGHLLSDTTRGLIDSGIVELALPEAVPSTRLPGHLYWIRAAVPHHAASVCDTLSIHAQAVSAEFEDRGNAPDHYAQRLPARTIAKLVATTPQIAAVEQPYPSHGGRPAEREQDFYTRVSERLRHKQRALTSWDYERLVLDRFPELYKVKCIAAQPDTLGSLELVIIPAVRGQMTANPFEPKAPASLIAQIEAFLADKTPPQATVRVRNAQFVPILVRLGVRFRRGGDEGFYKRTLNEELNRFLSPWAYDEGAEISIGGKIFANSIVSFVDARDYVDYVATIKLFSLEDGKPKLAVPSPSAGYFIETDLPYAVLVAAPQHEIDVITDVGYSAESFVGIDYMKIELDFIVG